MMTWAIALLFDKNSTLFKVWFMCMCSETRVFASAIAHVIVNWMNYNIKEAWFVWVIISKFSIHVIRWNFTPLVQSSGPVQWLGTPMNALIFLFKKLRHFFGFVKFNHLMFNFCIMNFFLSNEVSNHSNLCSHQVCKHSNTVL